MELTSQVLRDVEFGSELRGYKTAEVDDFLEEVAVGVEGLRKEIATLTERVDRAERLSERGGFDDEESIRRTLVLAQRTADLAVREAQEEAAQLLDGARSDAESIVADARQTAERVISEADRETREEVARLAVERERLAGEIETLTALIGGERARLSESLTTMLHFVEKNLTPSIEVSSAAEGDADEVDELEAAIAADAAAAAPSRPGDSSAEEEEAANGARPSLTALPSLEGEEDEVSEPARAAYGAAGPAS